ncbi:hypothetical protein HAX42_14010 [Enterococcus casseliflavus]|nr:hypothetical protein [Enterococcus casseliflavus]
MKNLKILLVTLFIGLFLVACGSTKKKADFTTKEAETALNNGEDINGKTVEITVDEYVPDGALGYTIQTGEHLNFVSSDNPNVEKGDTIIVKVVKTENVLGSFVMTFEKQ